MALTREEIARTGLRLLNDVGLGGLTLRLIADELGVKAPALYWHVENKQALLDEMATQMFLLHAREPLAGEGWVERLAERARTVRRMMLAYRDGAKVFSGTYFTDEHLPHHGAVRELIGAGYTTHQAARVLTTVYHFTVGFTIEQQAVVPMPGERDKRYDALEERGDPLSTALAPALFDDFDRHFDEGLEIVLLGVRAWLG